MNEDFGQTLIGRVRYMDNRVGEKIRQKRKQMGLTMKELAGERVTAAQISAVEKGKCKPSQGLMNYIAERLGVDAEYFTQSDEERYRNSFEELSAESLRLLEKNCCSEAIEYIDRIKDSLNYLDDRQKGSYYYIKGNGYYKEQMYKEAFDNYIKAMTYYSKTKDMEIISDIYIKTGNCLYNTEQYDIALSYYIGASKYISEKIKNDTVARILFDISLCYTKLKRYNLARESIVRCMDYINSNKVTDRQKFIAGLDMVNGIIDMEINKEKLSIDNFIKAFEKYKNENNVVGMGRAANNTGIWYAENGDYERAISYFYDAIKYGTETKDSILSDYYVNLAETYKDSGDSDKAMEIINKAEEIMLEESNSGGLIDIMLTKLDFIIRKEDYDKAEMYAFIVLDCIQKFQDTKAEEKLYYKMAEMYKRSGDENSSIQFLLRANKFTI
jgi:tetratricopeptide (TPR) repeat protein